jgi:hypothetical protein
MLTDLIPLDSKGAWVVVRLLSRVRGVNVLVLVSAKPRSRVPSYTYDGPASVRMLLCQGDLKISSAVRVVAQRPVNLRLPQILLEVVEQHSVLVCGNARGLRRKQRKRGVYILGREQLRLGLKLPDRRKDLRTA